MVSFNKLMDMYEKLNDDFLSVVEDNKKLRAEFEARKPNDAISSGMSPVKAAILHVFGPACPDFDPNCLTCKAWSEFSDINRLRLALHSICSFPNLDEDGSTMQDIARAALEEKSDVNS